MWAFSIDGRGNEISTATIYANTTIIAKQTITLTKRSSISVMFLGDTTVVAKGKYTITATATPIPDEEDIADNMLDNGIITVTIPGDVDGDFDVDIYDVVKMCGIYGSKKGDPIYAPNRDVNDDEIINIYDVVIACSHYGQKDP